MTALVVVGDVEVVVLLVEVVVLLVGAVVLLDGGDREVEVVDRGLAETGGFVVGGAVDGPPQATSSPIDDANTIATEPREILELIRRQPP